MGLLDILNGMQNGPGGQRQPTPPGKSGGMSPLMMALLGLLAYKAIKGGGLENMFGKGHGSNPTLPPPDATTAGGPGGSLGDILGGMLGGGRPGAGPAGAPGGGLGDILGGMLGGGARPGAGAAPGGLGDILGGLLGGAAAGGALNGGLKNILEDLENSGHGDVAKSWVSPGANRAIAPDDLAAALGADTIDALSNQTGMSRNDLLAGLSQELPNMVDQLTPDGRLPTNDEAGRWV